MTANTSPIFSAKGFINGLSGVLTTAAADFTGLSINNATVYKMDITGNGGYLQRLRFKARGTNITTTARIYICDEVSHLGTSIAAVTGTPTGTPSTTGGTLLAGNYFAKVVAVDGYGSETVASTETAAVAVTGRTGSIVWTWAAVTGAVRYEIYVGPVTGGQITVFVQTDGSLNTYTQTTMIDSVSGEVAGIVSDGPNFFYGEIILPATSSVAGTATASPDIDYTMNCVLPAGSSVIVGLSVTVASGWEITAIGGLY